MKNDTEKLKLDLQSFGFSQKESEVYIALLELGKGKVTEISRKAGINRTTGYDILDSLVHKGVISISGKEPKQEYAAEPPQAITEYLKREARKTEECIARSENITSELSLIYSYQNRPKIRFYEGIEGLQHVYEDTLTSHEEIRAYANVDKMHDTLVNYFPAYYKKRAKKGIPIRAIIPNTDIGKERKNNDIYEMRETALVPKETYYFTPEINIYDNKIMIASWREKLGIIIESEEITDAMKKIYELAWQQAKKFDQHSK